LREKSIKATRHNSGAQIAQPEFSSACLKTLGNASCYRPRFSGNLTEHYAGRMRAVNYAAMPYDFFMADEEHPAPVIADASGKGIPAALCSCRARPNLTTSPCCPCNTVTDDETTARVLSA
jgi:hypothetical protein